MYIINLLVHAFDAVFFRGPQWNIEYDNKFEVDDNIVYEDNRTKLNEVVKEIDYSIYEQPSYLRKHSKHKLNRLKKQGVVTHLA